MKYMQVITLVQWTVNNEKFHPLMSWQHRWLRSLVVGLINDPVLLLPVFLGFLAGNGWPAAACFRLFLASPLAPFDGLCFPFYFFLASPLAQLILPFPLRPFSLVFLFAFKLRTPLSHKKQHVESDAGNLSAMYRCVRRIKRDIANFPQNIGGFEK